MPSAHAAPILIDAEHNARVLERVPLSGDDSGEPYDEHWLQEILFEHAGALPISDIDRAFTPHTADDADDRGGS